MARSSVLAARGRSLPALVLLLLAGSSSARDDGCAVEPRREAQAVHIFLGYTCRDPDCGAHKAGFAWADRQGISDAAACADADDVGFGEGCRAFAELSVTAEQSGFEWARANALPDDCACGGAGPRFAAGCEAFVRAFGR
jgi:hypothetical protein